MEDHRETVAEEKYFIKYCTAATERGTVHLRYRRLNDRERKLRRNDGGFLGSTTVRKQNGILKMVETKAESAVGENNELVLYQSVF